LAIATSLSALLNAGLLGYNLWKDGVLKRYPGTLTYISKVTVATAAMAAAVLYLTPERAWWLSATSFDRAAQLAILIVIGAVVYAVGLLLLRVQWRSKH
jgi:putative peptidoglycan lipid II flippase